MMYIAKFEPKPDITIYELAQIVRVIVCGMNHDMRDPVFKFPGKENNNFEAFKSLAEIQRHFEIVEIEG